MKDNAAVRVADLPVAFHACSFTSRCWSSLGCAKSSHFLRIIATILRIIQRKTKKETIQINPTRQGVTMTNSFSHPKSATVWNGRRAIAQRVTSSRVTQVWLAFLTHQFCAAVISLEQREWADTLQRLAGFLWLLVCSASDVIWSALSHSLHQISGSRRMRHKFIRCRWNCESCWLDD